MFDNLKILIRQGKQYIPDVTRAVVPGIFRGRPVISDVKVDEKQLMEICPTGAISSHPVSIDLGKCTFCGECAFAFPHKIKFTTDYKIATNVRERLVVKEGDTTPVAIDDTKVRDEIRSLFGRSLKLREVSAAGANADFALARSGG